MTGKCYNCGQTGHKKANCPQGEFVSGNQFGGQQYNQYQSVQKNGGYQNAQKGIGASNPATTGQPAGTKNGQAQKATPGRKPGGANQNNAGRVFALQGEEEACDEEPAMIQGTFILYNSWVLVLVDTGATHSFISASCASSLELDSELLNTSMSVASPLRGHVRIERVCRYGELEFSEVRVLCDLHIMEMSNFDVILGMDLLSTHRAVLDCQ